MGMALDPAASLRVLMVDNYDSFVFNIVSYLTELGAEVEVIRNDQVEMESLINFDGIVISPGPGDPNSAGQSLEVIGFAAENQIPLLGICLGHQAIGEYFNSKIVNAPEVLHGKISQISHNNNQKSVLRNLPTKFNATRYHSLAIEEKSISDQLEIIARSESGTIMAITHKTLPIDGLQFHPESILTEHGYEMLKNWLDSLISRSARV
jgi:para-aminobenzoate synthetase component 2